MSNRPRLLRKQSSLAILVEQERETCESASRPPSEGDIQGREEDAEAIEEDTRDSLENLQPDDSRAGDERDLNGDNGLVDSEGGDTDAAASSGDETEGLEIAPASNRKSLSASQSTRKDGQDELAPPPRLSRRLMSMKRRGKVIPLVELTEEFEFYAGDVLTVRGEDNDFYVCRVLDDVVESADKFGVAWFNRLANNLYEPSFDDVCYMDSVITRVTLSEVEPEKFAISKPHVKQTKKLLKEALVAERGEEDVLLDEVSESEEADEEEEEEEPPAKRTRRRSKASTSSPAKKGTKKGAATPTKSPGRKRKAADSKPAKAKKTKEVKEKKEKPRPAGALIPNENVELLEKDPTFETREDLSLMPVKWATKAVILNDMEMLKHVIENRDIVASVHWPRSPEIQLAAIHYALLNENHEAIKLLLKEFHGPKNEQHKPRCSEPTVSLHRMDTGTYNFYTFGHAVRELHASRGSREGNSAFLEDDAKFGERGYETESLLLFCFTKGVSVETVQTLMNEISSLGESTLHEQEQTALEHVWMAIRHGNRKLAGYFVSKGVEKHGFGFNFLHKEVLLNDVEKLSNFRSPSVKKKPLENQNILPIHAACINPNGDYLRTLLNSVPEHSIPDREGFKPMHYAAACEGAGPLKILLARGADPNDPGPKGITPLMIACKHGRDEIVKELLTIGNEDVDDAMEDEEENKPRVSMDIKNKHTKAAIHYAAKSGHLSTIRLLVAAGANVDLQTGSYRGNVTALMLAASKGYLDVVKALVELKASPDKKGKWNKTALMYAVKNGHSAVAAYLLRIGVNPCSVDTSGNTPIHYAAAYGWLHCLKMLIKAGADPNAANQWKVTPLAIALMKDHMPCADYLLSLDTVDVNFPDDCGRTLLCQKLRCSTLDEKLLENVTFLVEKKGANVNKADIEQWTPLHYLAANSVYEEQPWDAALHWSSPPALKMPLADVSCRLAQLFISAGAKPDALNKEGQTPIMVAIMQNNFPLIETLLECGANGSIGKTSNGSQVLHVQAEKADELDLSNLYPDAHIVLTGNLEEQTEQKLKHLKSLVMRASNEMMEKLIGGGAEINCVREDGLTPLMLALSKGNMDQFSMLLDHDANPCIGLDKTGRNILHLLASKCTGHGDLRVYMKVILKKTDPENLPQMANLLDNNGFTPFLQACETIASSPPIEENNEFVKGFIKTLIDKFGCSVKSRVGKIKKGLNVSLRSPPSFRLTREKGKEVDISLIHQKQKMWIDQDEGGSSSKKADDPSPETTESPDDYVNTGLFTCLHFLVYDSWNIYPFLELVLEYVKEIKSIVNAYDCHGRMPLHLAVKWSNTKAAKLLIDHGADVNVPSLNQKDDGQATSLILASRPSGVCLLTLNDLLAANADPNIADTAGRTALSWAVTNPSDSNSTPLKLCKSLLEAGAHVNSSDEQKRTPLHYAVNSTTGDFETLTEVEDLLIKYGANTTALDLLNRFPLYYAFVKMRGRHDEYSMTDPISVVGLLCEAMTEQGKDLKTQLNHKDNFGQTPLHRAALRGATICALNLIQKGASLEMKDNDGNTPLSLALREGHDGCAMMFMQSKAPASCLVIKPLTPDDWKNYEKEKKESLWVWKNVLSLSEPKPDVRAAFRVVIDKNWQGIAYLMLEVSGLDFLEAIQATLESNKLDLTWALLRKQRKDSTLQGVDKKGRNLLHLLAIHCSKLWTQVVSEIAKHLVERGVAAGAVDSQGATPLHYAACNHNLAFCRFLWERSPSSVDVADNEGVTPFAAVFSNTESGMITLVEFFVSPSTCHLKNLDVCYTVRSGDDSQSQDSTTPLIEAVVSNNEKVVSDLLRHGASVNFPNRDGRTPIMEAVLDNLMDMVKVLIYATDDRAVWASKETTQVDLTLQDKNGHSVIHLCVQNREYGSAENVTLLNFLAGFDAPLTLRDSDGHTPLYYAKQQGSGVMAKALVELLGEAAAKEDAEEPMEFDSGFNFASVDAEYWESLATDPKIDSEKILEEAREQEKLADDGSVKVMVDSAFRMEGGGEVYVDPATGVPYDILMSKVDVKYGMFGLNNFYKMQIVHHKAKDLWVLFNRWGRIGDRGQHQRTPYNDPDLATTEFKKIFKSKTGNEWKNKDKFVKQPKKYALVLPERNPENKRKQMKEVLKPFDLTKCPLSHLSEEMQSFMKAITNYDVLNSAMSRGHFTIDHEYMPFGRLSKETIEKARNVLKEIKTIVDTIDRLNLQGTEEKFEEIAELSNTYYMLLPMAQYAYEQIKPLNESDVIEQHMDALYNLTELADASQILLAAQYRQNEVNPLDYVYKSIGCQIELMDPNSEECQLILEYIHNSKGGTPSRVKGIFRVSRAGEAERFNNCGVPGNHRLLWHGTETANMIGILQQGLRIAPPEASRSGWALGKGIYTSDSLEKSMNYTDLGSGCDGFVLLCEVALGNVKELVYYDYQESAPEGFDSVVLVSKEIPDPIEDVTTPYGAVVPAGVRVMQSDLEERLKVDYIGNTENEFVVYKESQVLLRYVVHLSMSWW